MRQTIAAALALTLMASTAMAAGTWADAWAAKEAGNYEEAVGHYQVCADEGIEACQFELGYAYDQGQGVDQDQGKAAKWFRLSARQGDGTSMSMMSIQYEYGSGVPQDLVSAYMWAELAVDASPNSQWRLDDVTGQLTQAQIAEGQALARDWAAKWLVQ